MKTKRILANLFRWSARLSAPVAILLMFVYLFFGVGYGLSNDMDDPWLILVYAAPMLVISLGYLVAYRRERAGALLSLLGFIGLIVSTAYFINMQAMQGDLPAWAFLLVPTVCFLASWWLRRLDQPKG